jgi:uncharacterized repeat protein (TIGR01451 family)
VVEVLPVADVGVAMVSSAAQVLLGGEFSYTIAVTNRGPSVATGVRLEDTLPAALSVLNVTTTQGAWSTQNGVVLVELREMGPGGSAGVTLTVRADEVGWVTNAVRVQSLEADWALANNTAEAVMEVVPAVDVGVAMVASAAQVLLGGEFSYMIGVTNSGPSVATGLRLEDMLPAGLTFVDLVTTQGVGTNDNGIVRVELGKLGIHSSAVVTLTVRADQVGWVTNAVSVQSLEADWVLANNTAEAVVEVVSAKSTRWMVMANVSEVLPQDTVDRRSTQLDRKHADSQL